MLERYFIKPETIDRIRASWIGKPIERYVHWLTENGYAARNVYRRVPILIKFGEYALQHGSRNFEDLQAAVDPFVNHWICNHGSHYKQIPRWVEHAARTPVEQMLRLILPGFKGKGRSQTVKAPFLRKVPGLFLYLRQERGLREGSILHHGHYLRLFEAYLEQIELTSLDDITPAILSAFLTKEGRRLSKSSVTGLCSSLRVFLQFIHREGVTQTNLSNAIEPPRKYQLSDFPRAISWSDVRRMLNTIDRRSPLGKRDYSILLLLVTYGLRANEVSALKLDDIDWSRERLLISERKAGHNTAYPLSSIVGEAIVDYLQNGRPKTDQRYIFFRVTAPWGPLTSKAISLRVTRYLHKAGIKVERPGSHTLRHTCVQRLVDAEFSFKTIGDYVGHASPSSTQIYTKIAVEALREMATGHGEDLP